MQALSSPHIMISVWQQTTQYYIFYGKRCDEDDCCKGLWADVSIYNAADDRIDFNRGATFAAPPFLIADQVIDDCFNTGNNDFDVNCCEPNSGRIFGRILVAGVLGWLPDSDRKR